MFRQSHLNAPFQVCQVHDHTGDVINLWDAYIQDLMCTGKWQVLSLNSIIFTLI